MWRIGRLVALGLAIVWGAATAQQALVAARDLQAGERLATSVRTATPAALIEGEAADRLGRAAARFARAHDRLRSPLFAPLRHAPVLGRHLTSLRSLSGSGGEALDAAHDAILAARSELRERGSDPASRLELLTNLAAIVGEVRSRFDDLDLGPNEALIPPLANARNELAQALAETKDLVERTETALHGVTAFLRGPSTYLLLVANNAEMRAGQGMILSVGEMSIVDGEITVGELHESGSLVLPPGAVPISGDLAARWGWARPSEEWRSLAMTPRFDVTAELAAQMWEATGRPRVDGVIAVDPFALRAVLHATGPVRVDSRRVGAGNIVDYTLHDQYVALGSGTRRVEQEERREEIDRIARAALDALTGRRIDAADLVQQLVTAGQGRHVMAWARDEHQQAAWEAARVDGSVASNSVLLSILNRGENKLDYFLRSTATLEEVNATPAGAEVTVTVTVTNTTPPGEPAYVSGPREFGVAEGEYLGIISLTVPGAARDLRVDGLGGALTIGPDGPTQVIAANFILPRGEAIEATFRFVLPPEIREVRVEPSARPTPTTWSREGVEWTDDRSRTVPLND